MAGKHTPGDVLPGPWVVDAAADRNAVGVADTLGNSICELYHGIEGWTPPSRCTTRQWKIDHARLIAAAPELLKACRMIVEAASEDDPMAAGMLAGCAVTAAEAAIARATQPLPPPNEESK